MSNTISLKKMSLQGRDFLKEEGIEGVRLTAYKDTGGVWTCGVGHTGADVKPNMVVTMEQVDKWLTQDIATAEYAVNKFVKVVLTQAQFDALVSFTFNLGSNSLFKSTLLRQLNAGDYQGAADQFLRWVFDNGKKLNGLVTRRTRERLMFLEGKYK